jgi:hypothetical protein
LAQKVKKQKAVAYKDTLGWLWQETFVSDLTSNQRYFPNKYTLFAQTLDEVKTKVLKAFSGIESVRGNIFFVGI